MNETNHDTIRKKIHWRHLRLRFFLFFGESMFWLMVAAVVVWAAGFLVVAPVAEAKISKLCNGAVSVKAGQFSGFGGIRLKGVVIAENTDALGEAPIFRFDEMEIALEPWKLLRGKFEVSSIFLGDFLFAADYDTQVHRWNFQKLARKEMPVQRGRMPIPFVTLRRGAVQIRRLTGDALQSVTTIGINGQIAAQASERQYNFALRMDERFGFGDTQIQGVLTMGSSPEKSKLSVQGRLKMPQAAVFENSWDLEEMQLECEFDAREILLKHCGFSMGAGQVDVQGAIRHDAENRRTFDLNVNLQNLELSDRHKKDAIVYSPPVLEMLDSGLKRFLTRYHPAGMGNMTFAIQGHLDDLSATVITGAIVCRDIAVQDDKFPYRLEQMQGTIELLGRNLTLNHLTCRHGDVKLLVDGNIRNLGPKAEIDLRTTSPNMQFDVDLYQALDESVKKMWFSFTPQGTTAVDYHFQRFADGTKDFTLTLGLTEADMVCEHFPYPLENLTGTVTMKPDRIEMKELAAHYHDGRKVTLNGEVSELGGPQPKFRIQVRAEHIPVDDLLINAMPAAQREFFDKLEIDAVAAVDVDVFPNAAGRRLLDYIAKIQIDGKHLVYAGFPLPMDDVHLAADVTQEAVRLHRFEGRFGDGRIILSGTLTPQGIRAQRPGLCLDVNLKAFDFNDVFWKAAEQDARRALGKFRMYGKMDVSGRLALNLPADSCTSMDLVIQCLENPVLWNGRPIGQVDGKLLLKDRLVLFEGFKLNHVQLEAIPEDLLEGKLKTTYFGIQPRGKISLQINSGSVRMGENRPGRIDVEGAVVCDNLTGGHEGVVNELTGEVKGRLQVDREKKTWQVSAAYDMDHFKYRRWLVSNLHGNLMYDPNTAQLESSDFMADLYGGRAAGSVEVDLSHDQKTGYKLGLSLSDVDVPQFLAAQIQDAPDKVMQGLAEGALNLEGDFQFPAERRGKAAVRIINMKLGKQSLMGKILTAMQFKQPDEFVFSEIESEAFVRGAELIIEDVRMVGKPLIFRGQGKLNLEQNRIELDLVAFDRWMGTEDTILDLLARGIGSAIWKVEVRGDMNNPQVDAVFLSVLKQPLEVFKKKQ